MTTTPTGRKIDNYRIEAIETTKAPWGVTYTAIIRARKDNFLTVHVVSAGSVEELLENALNLYGRTQ